MTILLLHAYGMGGTIRTALNLAGHLSTQYDVEVVSVARWRKKPFFEFPPGVHVRALDDRYKGKGGRRIWRALRRVLNRHPSYLVNPQEWRYQNFSLWSDLLMMRYFRDLTGVLITTRPALNVLAARYAPPGVRTIGQEHMNLASHRALLRADIERYYPQLDALAVLTEADLAGYSAVFDSARPRVVRIPNAVPALAGGPADHTAKVVIAAGRLTTQKGFDRLIRAWEPVAAAHRDWRLLILGEGPERERLEGLIASAGLAEVVALMGQTDRIGHAFAESSIFVLSSRREGLPMVILEAMSKGLPVVSFDCPTGPAEMVVTGHNGILVPDGDIAGLTRALLDVIEDDELRSRLGKGALETSERYDMEVIGQEWAHLVESLLAERPAVQSRHGR